MKVEMRLSAKADFLGLKEILLTTKKKVAGHTITMRAPSGIKIQPVFFSPSVGIDLNKRRAVSQQIRQHHIDALQKLNGLLVAISEAEPTSRAALSDLSAGWLRGVVDGYNNPKEDAKADVGKSLFEYGADFLKESSAGDSYRFQMLCSLRSVWRFEGFIAATGDARFRFAPESVTLQDVERFARFLRDEHDLCVSYPQLFHKFNATMPRCIAPDCRIYDRIERRGQNTVHGMLKRLRSLWRWMNDTGRVKNNPFMGFRNAAERYGVPYYLTIEERDRIASATMPTVSMEAQRDIFIFQCYIGCRVSDLISLTDKNITEDFLSYVPIKTHREACPAVARVPLHPVALQLIEKYKGKDARGRLFPFISLQKYNESIKAVFRIAGIDRSVPVRNSLTGTDELRPLSEVASSHLARRTFIANLYLRVQDPSIICKMSGHTEGSKAFSRYRKIEDDVLSAVVNKYL